MLIEHLNEPTAKQTEFLLKSISDRLSGREDCKRMTYTVHIDHRGVTMEPLVYVYKNRYSRKETDKMDIVSFVHKYKMSGARLDGFVFGTYEYRLTLDGNRRKWRKID